MKRVFRMKITTTVKALLLSLLLTYSFNSAYAEPKATDALTAMKKAARFMSEEVSYRGGYVFYYAEDLSMQWGEIPARPTQIWVQPPGTPAVGMMLLDAWKITGDPDYLSWAKRAADALIYGQYPEGGWHYLIDFDMPGLAKWYEDVAVKCWGWEEYQHFYGNCSFDDEATTAPTNLLLALYEATLDPLYLPPLTKALDFILRAQFPNGAWPQRFPLMYEHPQHGRPDYTSHYTLNDGVQSQNVETLWNAWEKLGREEYREAAVRGMDFYIMAQLPEPQAGWADQYDHDMNPAWARNFEPPAVAVIQTMRCIQALEWFYTLTGDQRYLVPIPSAIDWIERSEINKEKSKKFTNPRSGNVSDYTHSYYYEPVTNKPIVAHRSGTGLDDEKFWITNDFEGMYGYGPPFVVNLEPYKREYARINALSPDEALAEHVADRLKNKRIRKAGATWVETIIDALDNRGAWVTTVSLAQYTNDAVGNPPIPTRVIDIRNYTRSMYELMGYVESLNR